MIYLRDLWWVRFCISSFFRELSAQEIEKEVQSLLHETGLGGEKAERKIGGLLPGGIRIKGLSGGERRRLSLVRGIYGQSDGIA